MHDVDFEVILLSIKAMLTWAMHVEMVNVVVVRTFAVEISNFDSAKVSSL